jgi:hypothetical protein
MNSPPPSSPFILRVPNEIIYRIFSCLYDLSLREQFVEYSLNGKDYKVSQILVLRSVCRHFRAITAELNFWFDAHFRFTFLMPHKFGHRQTGEFLRALLGDMNLVNSLGQRKTDWAFDSLEDVKTVLERVPLFTQNARTIYLQIIENQVDLDKLEYLAPPTLDTAINALVACSHITRLTIALADTIDFGAIAASFPSLECLNCRQFSNFYGSLEPLGHLRTLRISRVAWRNDPPINQPWLPIRSAETLRELSLECGPDDDIPFFNADSLGAFVNLKSLNIRPLTETFCDFIIGAQIQLDFFEISVIRRRAPVRRVVTMLQAECLRNLKELKFSNVFDIFDLYPIEQYWSLVFKAFTSVLSSVEEVQLYVPLHLEWCPYFARMSNLKLLKWNGSGNQHFCGRTRDPRAEMVKALNAAFVDFMEKPQFAVVWVG